RLLAVWNRGRFNGNYARFHADIKAGMQPTQTPNLFSLGSAAAFLAQDPFQVESRNGARVSVKSARDYVQATKLPAPKKVAKAARRTRGGPEEPTTVALAL